MAEKIWLAFLRSSGDWSAACRVQSVHDGPNHSGSIYAQFRANKGSAASVAAHLRDAANKNGWHESEIKHRCLPAAIGAFAQNKPTFHCDRSHKSITKNALKSIDFSAFFTGAGGIRGVFLQCKNALATHGFGAALVKFYWPKFYQRLQGFFATAPGKRAVLLIFC